MDHRLVFHQLGEQGPNLITGVMLVIQIFELIDVINQEGTVLCSFVMLIPFAIVQTFHEVS